MNDSSIFHATPNSNYSENLPIKMQTTGNKVRSEFACKSRISQIDGRRSISLESRIETQYITQTETHSNQRIFYAVRDLFRNNLPTATILRNGGYCVTGRKRGKIFQVMRQRSNRGLRSQSRLPPVNTQIIKGILHCPLHITVQFVFSHINRKFSTFIAVNRYFVGCLVNKNSCFH